MGFKAIETSVLNQYDLTPVVAIQYELIVVALVLVIGAHTAAPPDRKGMFFEPVLSLASIALLMVVLASVAALMELEKEGTLYDWLTPNNLLTVWVPDVLGFIAIGRAVFATRVVKF
jgi:hypothetical protein